MTGDDDGSLADASGIRGDVDGPLLPKLCEKIAQMPAPEKGAAGDLGQRWVCSDYAAAPMNYMERVGGTNATDNVALPDFASKAFVVMVKNPHPMHHPVRRFWGLAVGLESR